MATQKHLNRECQGSSLFEDQCSPHAFLIDFEVSACHVCPPDVCSGSYMHAATLNVVKTNCSFLGFPPHPQHNYEYSADLPTEGLVAPALQTPECASPRAATFD
jgi:hypothetical protein